jgi:hypothetical protein
MSDYSAYFVNDTGYIVGVESIRSLTDNEAVAAARHLLIGTRFPSMEIWDASQCVAILDREGAGPVSLY